MADFVLGDLVRITDKNGDGVYQSGVDQITSIHNTTPLPPDDLAIQIVERQLGGQSLEGIHLQDAADFLTHLGSARREAREGNHFGAEEEIRRANKLTGINRPHLSAETSDHIMMSANINGARQCFETAAGLAARAESLDDFQYADRFLGCALKSAQRATQFGVDDLPVRVAAGEVLDQAGRNSVGHLMTKAKRDAAEGSPISVEHRTEDARKIAVHARDGHGIDVGLDWDRVVTLRRTALVKGVEVQFRAATDHAREGDRQEMEDSLNYAERYARVASQHYGADLPFDTQRAGQIRASFSPAK